MIEKKTLAKEKENPCEAKAIKNLVTLKREKASVSTLVFETS